MVYGEVIRVFNLHLQSNSISALTDKVAAEGNIQEKETWLNIRGIVGRFKRAAQLRARQAEEIALKIAQSPHPVIVGGDFNDTPQSYTYHTLVKELNDTFKQCGRGIGSTYSGKIPALRIDYVLSSKHFKSIRHKTYTRRTFSDHYPVESYIEWK